MDGFRQKFTLIDSDSPGEWAWQKLERLKLLDRVMQETLRLDLYGNLNLRRVVVEIIKMPDGLRLNKGTITASAVHRDPTVHDEPDKLQPYRFLGAPSTRSHEVSEQYLPFGHGRRNCPGRWHGTAMVKIIVAQLITNFDFECESLERHWFRGPLPAPLYSVIVKRRNVKEV